MFSEALNLWLRWEDDQTTHVRLLRPYLPDDTPINTSMEIKHQLEHEKNLREEKQLLREEEQHRREEAEAKVSELEAELERLRSQITNKKR